jgi:hypothetical protein
MCLLWGTNWVFIPQKTAFFIVTAVKPKILQVTLRSLRCCHLLTEFSLSDVGLLCLQLHRFFFSLCCWWVVSGVLWLVDINSLKIATSYYESFNLVVRVEGYAQLCWMQLSLTLNNIISHFHSKIQRNLDLSFPNYRFPGSIVQFLWSMNKSYFI